MADGLALRIEPVLDERAASAAMNRAQRVYSEGARTIARDMRELLTDGAREGGRAIERMADEARSAYSQMGEATRDAERAERDLQDARQRGGRDIDQQARRAVRAREDEERAIREAARAYDDYEDAARRASNSAGEGFSGTAGAALGAGRDAADNFVSGFAGASALTRLASLAIPGVGWVAAGVTAGTLLAQGVAQGLETLRTKDLFQARLGVDDATMRQYGQAAASAYTDAWGTSVADNLRAVQFAVQGGVIAPEASNAQIEQTISHMQALAQIMEVDVQEAARATGQLIRGGFAADGTEAADIIVSGFQRGLDISGDWLDTVDEYTTQFRKLGIDGADALGLIQQGLQGAARDSDVVADSMKEFSLRAVDGSALTAEGFAAIGFNADELAQRFLAGGETARAAFGATLQALRDLENPQERALAWAALFGTQWEDMGDAINKMDLSTARTEFGSTEGAIQGATDKLSEHVNKWELLRNQFNTTFADLKDWLADSAIGRFFSDTLPTSLNNLIFPDDSFGSPGAPGVPAVVGPTTTPGVHGPGLTPGTAVAPPAGASSAGPQNPLLAPYTPGALPAPTAPQTQGPGLRPPTPGARTPMLTETQQQALDEATGGSGESLPPAPALPLQYTNTAGMPTQVANATTRLDEAAHDVAEKEARVNQLRQTNVATEEDIQTAENALAQSEQRQQQAERALQDAKTNQVEQMIKESERFGNRLQDSADRLGQIGAQLDDDFGVSDGLAGIAENITRFVGNLALAAAAGPLRAQQAAMGYASGETGGGLVGIASQMGAFGPQYQVLPQWLRGAVPGGDGASMPYFSGGAAGSNVNAMPALAQGASGRTDYAPASDLINGLADCSGSISDLYEVLTTGQSTGARMFTTTNFASDAEAAKLGFRPGYMPGALNVGVNPYPGQSGHMAATLPNGVNFEGGGATGGGAQYGGNAAGALDPQFEKRYYFPIGGGGGTPSSGPNVSLPSLYGPANTSPALNNPGAPSSSPGWAGPTGVPSSLSGGGGESPIFGATPAGPGLGAGVGANGLSALIGQAAPSQSVPGGRAWNQGNPASGGPSFGGGVIGAALSTAAGAAGAAGSFGAGGGAASAAMDLGMQLAGRAIGAGSQYVGNAVSGVLETFMLNDSALGDPSSSWVGRILGAATGVKPALPNTAGTMGGEQNPNMAEGGKPQPPGPLTPEQAALHEKAMGAGGKGEARQGDTYNINTTVNRANEDQTGRVIQDHLAAQSAAKWTNG